MSRNIIAIHNHTDSYVTLGDNARPVHDVTVGPKSKESLESQPCVIPNNGKLSNFNDGKYFLDLGVGVAFQGFWSLHGSHGFVVMATTGEEVEASEGVALTSTTKL